jgi:hypothetical protein
MRSGTKQVDAGEVHLHSGAPELRTPTLLFDRQATATLLSYLALSILIFGRGLFADPATGYLGRGPDALANIWFFAWWAHAIAHHLNPFETTAVWAPSGVNLAWTTTFPLASCLFYPVTRLWGAIVACNVGHLIGLPLAGWSAFVLCRYVVYRFWPAWFGGCLFAFSPYMLTAMIGGGLFMLVFSVPLGVWATLRRLAGEMEARGFVAILVLLLVSQFLLSVEIFATAALFGAIAIALTARSASGEEYSRLISAAWSIGAAYVISAVILSPYLYYMLALGVPEGTIFAPKNNAADLLNFLVPTGVNELGRLSLFGTIASYFRADLSESRAYLGLPLLALIVLIARERWHDRDAKFVVCMFTSACVLAMGPFLEVAGHIIMPLPGAALAALPLIDKALPGRFMMYAYLAAAVLVAMWLAAEGKRPALRWVLGLAIIAFMLPALSVSLWTTPVDMPSFFTSGAYRQFITPGQTVMVLPYGFLGEGDLWQVATNMYFRMPGGYVGYAVPIPAEHSGWPIMAGLYNVAGVPEAGNQLKAYLASHDVTAVIVGRRTNYIVARMGNRRISDTWLLWPTIARERIPTEKLLASLNTQPVNIGGVTLYRIAPQTLAPYRNLTALVMQRRMARARFEALLLSTQRYLAQGGDPVSLSPERAQHLGLLPQDWFGGAAFTATDANPHYFNFKVVLGPSQDGRIAVGIEGLYDTLQPIIGTYGIDASKIYFPYPVPFSSASVPHKPAMMVMTFDRAGLERAVAAARHDAAGSRAAQPSHGDRRFSRADR